MKNSLFLSVLLCGVAFAAGNKPAAPAPAPAAAAPAKTIEEDFIPLSPDVKGEIRDHQVAWDQLEIEIQSLQARIEHDRLLEELEMEQIKIAANGFVREKNIDVKIWQLDPKSLKFAKRKPEEKKPEDKKK